MNLEQHERYVRWQEYRVNHLSFSINLFLGFSVASLAYAIDLKLKNSLFVAMPLELVIMCWSASAGLGCVATITKLLDYRYTARKIKDGGACNAFIAKYSGLATWGFFWSQIISYAVGAGIFIKAVVNA